MFTYENLFYYIVLIYSYYLMDKYYYTVEGIYLNNTLYFIIMRDICFVKMISNCINYI